MTAARAVLAAPLLLAALAGGAPAQPASPPASASGLDAFVVAHPDDWQLFMGDVAIDAIRAGRRTLFVYLTAGDAGQPARYWRARERGALASVALALGAPPPDSSAEGAGPPPGCADTAIAGRAARRCRAGVATSVFLRLPDGNMAGEGFASTGAVSLARLAAGGAAMAPLEGAGAYADWPAVVAAVAAVLDAEAAAAGGDVRVHASAPDSGFNPRDHSDHRAAGRLAAAVAAGRGWTLRQYAGYSTAGWPTNLSVERYAAKAALFLAYDRTRLLADPAWSAYAEAPASYSAWLSRTYVRPEGFTGRSP